MYSRHEANSEGLNEAATIVSEKYDATDVTRAATITQMESLLWNLNSPEELEMDSNPTNAHGASATMLSTCSGMFSSLANNGENETAPPS